MNWEGFSATDLSAAGLVGLAVLLVFIGQLIPKYVVTMMRTDRDQRLVEAQHETQNWKTAYEQEAAARLLQAQQLGELLELAKLSNTLIRSLQLAAARKAEPSP